MARLRKGLFTRGPNATKPELQSDHLAGAFRAAVEYNCDPEQRGRVKIRFFALHGPQGTDIKKEVKTDDLPWALPCFPLAGGQGYGSFVVPPVGSTAWVMAAGGEPDQFVYLGGYYAINHTPDTYLRSMEQPKAEISMVGTTEVWTGDKGPEVPLEALEMLHSSPEIVVPAKTVKGAALVMDDKDERESTALIDRAGQGLFFEAEVQKGPNLKNAKQRRARNLNRGKSPISIPGDTVANETRVLLVDAGGQALTLHAHKGSERVRLTSRPVEDGSSSYAGHKNGIAVELDAGSRRVAVTTSSSGDSGARIVVDAAAKYVEIAGDVTVRILAANVEISGRMTVRGDLLVDGDTIVTGDHVVSGRLTGGEK